MTRFVHMSMIKHLAMANNDDWGGSYPGVINVHPAIAATSGNKFTVWTKC